MKNLKDEITAAVNFFKSGNISKSKKIAKRLIEENPNQVFLYNLMGMISSAENKIADSIKYYQNGLVIDPNYAMIYNNLGLIYYENTNLSNESKSNNFEEAENLYKKSISLDENVPETHTNLGNLYNFLNRSHESIESHLKAIKVNSKFWIAYINLSNVYVAIGKYKEAKESLEKAIILKPDLSIAHRLISRLINYKKNDKHLNHLKKLYDELENKNSEDKINISVALGKAYEDTENFDKSFECYKKANVCKKEKITFSMETEKKYFDEIKFTYSLNLIKEMENFGSKKDGSIFIVGMPRSGSTLIEQIISSHSKVHGADEIETLPKIVDKYFRNVNINLFLQGVFDLDKDILQKMGNEYESVMKKISKKAKKTTDKLLINFLNIGLIKIILPKSKIIHCYRDPKDNVFSIFKNQFTGDKINYAYDINDIISYYNQYKDLMNYWNKIFPTFIYNIKYENLINDTENQIKNLIKFCDLKWEDGCLKFYNNKKPIKTASDTQARSKIYNSSINSWKNYKKHFINDFNKLI